MNDELARIPDTPEALETRMRATRNAMRARLALASHGLAQRTRQWPLWLLGSVALAGLGLGLARSASRAAPVAARRAAAAPPASARLATILGLGLRFAPLARRLLHAVRAQSR